MITIVYNKKDLRYIFILHDGTTIQVKKKGKTHVMQEIAYLEEYLNKIPSYQFLPNFSGIPKPVVYLEKTRINGQIVHYCSGGLWLEIINWCKRVGIKYDSRLDNNFKLTDFVLGLEDFRKYIIDWGLNIDPYDYQVEAAWKILHYRSSLSQLATRAGKTLIAYIIFRYMLENGAHNILMVVPSISLVKQGMKDMSEYKEFFKGEAVWAKGEYVESANLTIGTFQSLVNRCSKKLKGGRINKHYNPKFFDKFDVICIDECHKAGCDSIKEILSQPFMKNTKIKFGFSGTLPDEYTIESFDIQALLGPCIQDLTSRELIDKGFLANPVITQIRIHYKDDQSLINQYIKYGEYLCSYFETDANGEKIKLPKEHRDMTMIYKKTLPISLKAAKEKPDNEYREFLIELCKAQGSNLLTLEQMIAEHSNIKLQIIDEILFSWSKNGIVFAHNEAYIDFLYDYFHERYPERHIYKIKGSTTIKKRESIKLAMNTTETDAILFASYGCVGTGLTFKNIDYCIFAQSFKSKSINLQSIGRGLLLAEDKTDFYVYDIIDCLPTKRLESQGEKKCKLYDVAKYEYKIITK